MNFIRLVFCVVLFFLQGGNSVFALESEIANITGIYEDVNQLQALDLVIGSEQPDALTIVEFSSLACPHCSDFHHSVMPELEEKYIKTKRIRYIYRDFPTNKAASYASVVAYCFDDKRFKILNILFKTQNFWAFFPNFRHKLYNIAELGNNLAVMRCMDNNDIEQNIMRKAYINAKKYNIDGTPVFFIDGKKYDGKIDRDSFIKFLENVIASKKAIPK